MYYYGTGVERDVFAGAEWARKAAEAGLPAGQYLYAWYLENGEGVEEDTMAARGWLERAAAQGDPHAIVWMETLDTGNDAGSPPVSHAIN
jgi:TPR repeat protein